MQPPASTKDNLAAYGSPIQAPDDTDMLVNAKNHDIQISQAVDCDLDDWAYAFITRQTMGTYPAKFTYNVSRMNGGYGNRPP